VKDLLLSNEGSRDRGTAKKGAAMRLSEKGLPKRKKRGQLYKLNPEKLGRAGTARGAGGEKI